MPPLPMHIYVTVSDGDDPQEVAQAIVRAVRAGTGASAREVSANQTQQALSF